MVNSQENTPCINTFFAPFVVVAGGYTTSKKGPLIAEIPLEYIRRPLLRTRNNDPEKVKQLMESIAEIGLQEPVSHP